MKNLSINRISAVLTVNSTKYTGWHPQLNLAII